MALIRGLILIGLTWAALTGWAEEKKDKSKTKAKAAPPKTEIKDEIIEIKGRDGSRLRAIKPKNKAEMELFLSGQEEFVKALDAPPPSPHLRDKMQSGIK